MDMQGIADSLVEGLHFFSSLAGGVVVAAVALVMVLGAMMFLKKDQRGTENGKEMLKNSMITLAVVALAWVVSNAAFMYFSSLA